MSYSGENGYIPYNTVLDKMVLIFLKYGVNKNDANLIASILLEAEVRGYPSQGVIRLFEISDFLKQKTIKPERNIQTNNKTANIRIYECTKTLGHPVAYEAITWCANNANTNGISLVGINGASHIGYLTYYAEAAAKENCFCLITSSTSPAVSLPNSQTKPLLGTNPICYAFPLKDKIFCADFSTAEVSRGIVLDKKNKDEKFQKKVGYDQEGRLTNDPNEILKGGIAPLGGEVKGVLLNLLLGILAGPLIGGTPNHRVTGTRWSNEIPNKSDFILCISLEKICNLAIFQNDIHDLLNSLKEASSKFHIPGHNSRAKLEQAKQIGIKENDLIKKVMSYS
jgi:L-2-hydroxycarboxylate dehydrogenase (NAD+)